MQKQSKYPQSRKDLSLSDIRTKKQLVDLGPQIIQTIQEQKKEHRIAINPHIFTEVNSFQIMACRLLLQAYSAITHKHYQYSCCPQIIMHVKK